MHDSTLCCHVDNFPNVFLAEAWTPFLEFVFTPSCSCFLSQLILNPCSQQAFHRGSCSVAQRLNPTPVTRKGFMELPKRAARVPTCPHQAGVTGFNQAIWHPIKITTEHFPFLFLRCLWQWTDNADTQTDPAGEDCPDPSLWLCHSFQVSATLSLLTDAACPATIINCSCSIDSQHTVTVHVKQVPHTNIPDYEITIKISTQPCLNVVTEGRKLFCVCVSGKRSLLRCIRLMWSYLRASWCSTHRRSEIYSRWNCLLTQTQTHGSHVEVCVLVFGVRFNTHSSAPRT